jgi:hypothetical protein
MSVAVRRARPCPCPPRPRPRSRLCRRGVLDGDVLEAFLQLPWHSRRAAARALLQLQCVGGGANGVGASDGTICPSRSLGTAEQLTGRAGCGSGSGDGFSPSSAAVDGATARSFAAASALLRAAAAAVVAVHRGGPRRTAFAAGVGGGGPESGRMTSSQGEANRLRGRQVSAGVGVPSAEELMDAAAWLLTQLVQRSLHDV